MMAIQMNISLLVYGENVSYEYGGENAEETYSARNQLNNGVASDIPFDELKALGLSESDLILLKAPEESDLEKIDPIYLSYFVEWNSIKNYEWAKKNGFHDLKNEWRRTNHVEDFDQVDSRAYLVHAWMKYPKFGHAAATDYASRMIRYGVITREEGIELVKKHDSDLDKQAISDFCDFLGYSEPEFWKIVDKFYNKDIFYKDNDGIWHLKNPIWKENE